MQFAKLFGKIIQASIDAPEQAWCVYCGYPVHLEGRSDENGFVVAYIHLAFREKQCQAARDKIQKELDAILRIENDSR